MKYTLIPLFWGDLSQFSKKPNKTLRKFIFIPLLFRRRLFHLKALFRHKSRFLAGDSLI